MKKIVRLNESELKNIINESIKKILNEEYCWWGDTKPLEEIYKLASQIVDKYSPYFDNNEGDEDDRAIFDLYNWAGKVAKEAEEFIRYNADNLPINGGENW